jgi:hypothetical protein
LLTAYFYTAFTSYQGVKGENHDKHWQQIEQEAKDKITQYHRERAAAEHS